MHAENPIVESANTPTESTNHGSILPFWIQATVLFILAFSWSLLLLGQDQAVIGRDSYYHLAHSRDFRELAFTKRFPWTQYSVWKDHYADKEWLFHALLSLIGADQTTIIPRGKIFQASVVSLLMLVFLKILQRNGVRFALLWSMLLLLAEPYFCFRVFMIRPHVFSIIATLLAIHLLLQSRERMLLPLGFILSWMHSVPHLIIGIAAVDCLIRGLLFRNWKLGGVGWSALGVFAGLLLHPQTPNSMLIWYVQNVHTLKNLLFGDPLLDLQMALELKPFALVELKSRTFIWSTTILTIISMIFLIFRRRSMSEPMIRVLGIALVLGGLLFVSYRFADYFIPILWLGAAMVLSPFLVSFSAGGKAKWISLVILGLVVFLQMAQTAGYLTKRKQIPIFREASQWLKVNVAPGKTIVNADWPDFAELFFHDPLHYYVAGMDLSFSTFSHPEQARLLCQLPDESSPFDPEKIVATFKSEFLIVSRMNQKVYRKLIRTDAEIVYSDKYAYIFRLVGNVEGKGKQ